MSNGWITLHRKIQKASWYGNPEYVSLFIHMLLRANHKPANVLMGNQLIKLKRGQFVSGRKVLAKESGIQESKVTRIISVFKTEQQVEQQAFSKFSVFTMVNYHNHQKNEQQVEQQMNSKRTASEQQMNTNNNVNKYKQCKQTEIIDYLNKKTGSKFKPVDSHIKLISARIKEGHTIDDIKKVIDSKCDEWLTNTEFKKYLRPATLFNTEKFNQYVGQLDSKPNREQW